MKRLFIWGALVATLIAMYFAPESDDVSVVSVSKPVSRSSGDSAGGKATVDKSDNNPSRNQPHRLSQTASALNLHIIPRKADQDLGNVFDSKLWVVPPLVVSKQIVNPLPPLPPPVVAPQAPPLPLKYMGRWMENEVTTYFFLLNEQSLALKVGDVVNGQYQFESSQGGTLTFLYLPLSQKQTLVVGEAN